MCFPDELETTIGSALVLSKSTKAIAARSKICNGLGLSNDEISELEKIAKTDHYNYFISMLRTWRRKNGAEVATFEKLVAVLRELGLELNEVAGSFILIIKHI